MKYVKRFRPDTHHNSSGTHDCPEPLVNVVEPISPPGSTIGSPSETDASHWSHTTNNMGLSSELPLSNGEVSVKDEVGTTKAPSTENHHGESPFSNSDSVSSFSDKPGEFTAAAYQQLYQSGMGGYNGGSYLQSSSFYNGGQAYHASSAAAAAALSQSYPGGRGSCKGGSNTSYLYAGSPFPNSGSGSYHSGSGSSGYSNYHQIPPAYHHADYSPYAATFQSASTAAASPASVYYGHPGPTPSSYYYNSSSPSAPSSATASAYQIPSNPTIPDNIGFLPAEPSSPSPTIRETKPKRARTGGRGRRPNPSPDPEHNLERVFVWDLDETIILFHSLLSRDYGHTFKKSHQDTEVSADLALTIEGFLYRMAEKHFFFNDLEDCDQVHIDDASSDDNGQDLSTYDFLTDSFKATGSGGMALTGGPVRGGVDWMRKLAFRYRKIKEIYTLYRHNAAGLLSPGHREEWRHVRREIELMTNNWLTSMLKCLSLVNSRPNCVNILVTQTQLVPALAKILLHDLGPIFPIENVYSATKTGKENCFERIVTRFGRRCTYVVIGDGDDEDRAAKQMNFPFWRIMCHKDIISLYNVMEMGYL